MPKILALFLLILPTMNRTLQTLLLSPSLILGFSLSAQAQSHAPRGETLAARLVRAGELLRTELRANAPGSVLDEMHAYAQAPHRTSRRPLDARLIQIGEDVAQRVGRVEFRLNHWSDNIDHHAAVANAGFVYCGLAWGRTYLHLGEFPRTFLGHETRPGTGLHEVQALWNRIQIQPQGAWTWGWDIVIPYSYSINLTWLEQAGQCQALTQDLVQDVIDLYRPQYEFAFCATEPRSHRKHCLKIDSEQVSSPLGIAAQGIRPQRAN